MQGAKTLGTDVNGQPVYKYYKTFNTDANGQFSISDLEWDSYGITISGTTGYDIANSFPPQPININPGVNQTVTIKLANHQPNSLLVTVKDSAGQPLIGANVRLYRIGYDKTKLSTDSGQAFYSSLAQATYNLEVKLVGYSDYLNPIDVSGTIEQMVIMTAP